MNITIKDGHIHIEGYPDGRRLVKLPKDPFGKRLTDLRLHEHDLQYCEEAMQRYRLHRQEPDNQLDNNTYFIAILAKYFACFKYSAARTSLKEKAIFGDNKEALAAFKYLENMRDKHIIHDENPLNLGASGIVLGESNNVIDILSLSMHAYFPDEAMTNNLQNLIQDTQRYLASEIEICLKSCRQWLAEKSPEELASYPDLKTEWTPNDVDKKRDY